MYCVDDNAPELFAKNEVNDKVNGGIEDQREVIEAGHAEEPGGRKIWGTTSDNIKMRDISIYLLNKT